MRTAVFDGIRPPRLVRLGLALAAALWLLLGSASALAAGEPHPLVTSFGSFTNPNGIAVDEATGDVYVADLGTDKVHKFDASGKPASFSSLGSDELTGPPGESFSFPSEAGTPAAIAVDDACAQHSPALSGKSCEEFDPSGGDLYVMDAGHGVIDKFSADGRYLSQITGPFSGKLFGFGLDRRGNVRIYTEAKYIALFDDAPSNRYVRTFDLGRDALGGAAGAPKMSMAVDPSGDYYLLFSCGCMEKFGGNAEPLGRVDGGSPSDIAVAVDPATGHVYVDDQSSVVEWDPGAMNGRVRIPNTVEDAPVASEISAFGSSQLSASTSQGGIAVNGATGQIYVSNPADGKVYVFGSAAPGVGVSAPTNLGQTSATLEGTVTPQGSSITSCEFEYESVGLSGLEPLTLEAPVTSFGHKVHCAQSAAQIGSGMTPVKVSADIGGLEALEAGKLYDFRLVAANAEGSSSSSGRFATAGPGFGLKSFEVSFLNENGTPDTQAGSHPYKMVTDIAFNTRAIRREAVADSRYVIEPDGNVRDITVDLPPGLVGDANATSVKCTLKQLNGIVGENSGGGHCPEESKVGQLEVEFGAFAQNPIKEPVYLMVPPRGVAVQIGGQFIIPNALINAGVLPGGDYPVRSTSLEIPTIEPIISTRLTVEGVVGKNTASGNMEGVVDTRKPFLTLPTGCTGPLKSTIQTSSYQDPAHSVKEAIVTKDAAGEPLGLTGCSKLAFPPTITVTPDTTDASTSSGLTVGVHISQKGALNPEGLAESALRDTTVTLPEGVALNPAGADGLEACAEGLAGFTGFNELNPEFEHGVQTATFTPELPNPLIPGANFCPNGSKIGTVEIRTPLLSNPLTGAVYLAAQNANPFGSLVAMYMIAEDPVSGTLIKLTGEVKLTDTGQIVTTFNNTPDLPFEDLELHFFGGERAPLTTPAFCRDETSAHPGAYTTQAVFTPWDGNGPVTTTSSFKIDHGPNGSPCPGTSLPFNPSLTAGTTNNQAGGFSPFTMTMSREDGQQNLQAIDLKMPPGLSGYLTGLELCPEPQADEGLCGPNSLIGETVVSVGVGNDPFSVMGGRVYLTGPYKGAPFGLSIVNPAKAGPYDVEHDASKPGGYMPSCDCVVVRARIEVDPITAGLTIMSDNEGPYKIPTILDGIPLQIKHVNVTINRPGFTFNPTNCEKMQIGGGLHSAEGASSVVSVPFQTTNCARLSFKPGFAVVTSGKTSRHAGASLHVKLSYPKLPFGSQANIRSVKVSLPRQLPSRLETLNKACVDTVFDQNPAACPAASRVGTARAITPILPVSLQGPAYFVSHGDAKFPELIVVLQGYGVTVDLHGETFIDKKTEITRSTFHTVPDVPVGTFELNLPQGHNSALAANGSLCSVRKTVLVKKKVTIDVHGHKHIVNRKVNKTVPGGLAMPTTITAQSGAVIVESVPIRVTGCRKVVTKGGSHQRKGSSHKPGSTRRGGLGRWIGRMLRFHGCWGTCDGLSAWFGWSVWLGRSGFGCVKSSANRAWRRSGLFVSVKPRQRGQAGSALIRASALM